MCEEVSGGEEKGTVDVIDHYCGRSPLLCFAILAICKVLRYSLRGGQIFERRQWQALICLLGEARLIMLVGLTEVKSRTLPLLLKWKLSGSHWGPNNV